MIRSIALSVITAVVAFATTAHAQDCSNFAYGEGATGYVLQDAQVVASDEAVLQGAFSRTCDKVSYTVWGSALASGDGSFGNRGFGDEIDVGVSIADTMQTPLGRMNVSASADYFVLADFGDFGDDLVQIAVEANLPLNVYGMTVTPYIRPIQWLGTGDIDDQTLVRPGVRFSIPLTERISASADIAQTFTLSEGRSHTRAQARLSYDLGGGTSLWLQGKFTQDVQPVFGIGVSRSR